LLAGTATYERVLQHSVVANLNVISSGRIPQNPAEYLGSETMNKFIDDMKKEYDTIFFDSPPVLAVTDASVLSSYAQKIVLVVSAGTTTIQALDRAAESLEAVGATVAGVILNNFDLKKAYGHLYHKGSYGYYGYSHGPGRGVGGQAREPLPAAKK
jgi:capsular exopolysaccharide synthesis family protein